MSKAIKHLLGVLVGLASFGQLGTNNEERN